MNQRTNFLGRLLTEWGVLACFLLALIGGLAGSGLTQRADSFIYDFILPLHERDADPRVILIKIDEPSIARLGQWPWNRSVHGQLFEKLAEAKPRAVLFDVIVTEPASDEGSDAALGAGMAKLPRIVAPVLMENNNKGGLQVTLPIESVQSVAQLGHIAILPDDDGVVREVGGSVTDDQGKRWPLMTTLLDEGLTIPNQETLRVPFNVPFNGYLSFSVSQVLAGEVPADFLRDKYVLIGATATGLGDRYLTPNAKHFSAMPGVEIHANILDALLNGLNVQVLNGWWWALLPVAMLLLALLLLRERYHLWVFLAAVVGYVVLVVVALWQWLYWIPPTASLCGLVAAYVLWSWRRMAVMLHHVRTDLLEWRAQTGVMDSLLPSDSVKGIAPHALELNIAHAHHLSQFVTGSLQNLPVAVLLVNDDGVVLMHNAMAHSVFAPRELLRASVMDLLGLTAIFQPQILEEHEWRNGAAIYRVHIVPMHFSNPLNTKSFDHVIWQVSLIDLSNERTAQNQRNELMTFLSHDLRVPQVGILSLVDIYRSPDSLLSIESLLEQVCDKAQHTLDVANGLVHLAQAQDGRYQMMEVNFVTLTHSAISQIWAQARAKNIELVLDRAMDEFFEAAWIWGDAGMLTRVLLNLLSNAVRYSEAHTRIFVSLVVINQEAICSIRDQGQGMSARHIAALNANIMEQPETHIRSAPDAAGSLGVGLNMVATVLHDHQGRVVFRDATMLNFERGTQVDVYLPVLPVEEE